MAVGARSGHEEPEDRPGRSGNAESAGAAGHAGIDGETPDGGGAVKKPRSFWKELPLLVVIALVLALLIKTFLVQAFSIPSDSMQ
ncbi:signal peptidase I, partial [Streptomyces sp. NPDC001274]